MLYKTDSQARVTTCADSTRGTANSPKKSYVLSWGILSVNHNGTYFRIWTEILGSTLQAHRMLWVFFITSATPLLRLPIPQLDSLAGFRVTYAVSLRSYTPRAIGFAVSRYLPILISHEYAYTIVTIVRSLQRRPEENPWTTAAERGGHQEDLLSGTQKLGALSSCNAEGRKPSSQH